MKALPLFQISTKHKDNLVSRLVLYDWLSDEVLSRSANWDVVRFWGRTLVHHSGIFCTDIA